jgi:hypothetical protein
MKTNRTIRLLNPLSTATLTLVLLGCGQEQTVNQANPESPRVTASEVKKKTQDALSASKNLVVQTKDEFVAASDLKLRELDVKIDGLAQKSAAYQGEAKLEADKALTALHDQRDKAKQKFTELKAEGAEGWSDVKAGFLAAMNDLEVSYETTKTKFNL